MFIAFAMAILGTPGCSSLPMAGNNSSASAGADPDSERRYLFQKHDDWIALAPAEGAETANDHPVTLGDEHLYSLLSGLRAQLDESRSRGLFGYRGGRTVSLFTETMLDRIVSPLHNAFQQAGPTEDVLLHVTQNRPGQYLNLISEQVVTTARLFHHEGNLHLILGTVDGVDQSIASTNPGNSPKSGSYRSPGARLGGKFQMGSRERPASIRAALQTDNPAGEPPDGRDDWLVLAIATADRKEKKWTPRNDVSGVSNETADQQTGDRELPADRYPENIDEDTLERLQQLRDLRRNDLITAPAYESMVRELLDIGPNDSK